MRMLSASWTAESIALWKQLRQTVLCHPRADESLRETDPVIRSYYLPIPLPKPAIFTHKRGIFPRCGWRVARIRQALQRFCAESTFPVSHPR